MLIKTVLDQLENYKGFSNSKVSTSTRGGGFKKSVGRSKRHGQRITRPPLKGGSPGYIPVRASSFWSSFS